MIEEKIHEYVKVYKKQLRKPIERNSLLLVDTPAKTETSDGSYLGKFAHLFFIMVSRVVLIPRWRITHLQVLLVFQDGRQIKFPTNGQRSVISQFTVGSPPRSLTFTGALRVHF